RLTLGYGARGVTIDVKRLVAIQSRLDVEDGPDLGILPVPVFDRAERVMLLGRLDRLFRRPIDDLDLRIEIVANDPDGALQIFVFELGVAARVDDDDFLALPPDHLVEAEVLEVPSIG